MGSSLQAEIHERASDVLIRLRGEISEGVKLDRIFGAYSHDRISVDLAGIQRLNSIGVYVWIRSFSPFSRNHEVTVRDCSYAVVLQANSIPNFFGQAAISSCLAPYVCQRCGDSEMLRVSVEDLEQTGGAPERGCSKCQQPLEFDELDSYFLFMRRHRVAA